MADGGFDEFVRDRSTAWPVFPVGDGGGGATAKDAALLPAAARYVGADGAVVALS